MTINKRGDRWFVRMRNPTTGRSVERTVSSKEIASELHKEIQRAWDAGEEWRYEASRVLRRVALEDGGRRGTLRIAAELALRYHYKDTSYGKVVEKIIWPMIAWFEDAGAANIDDIRSSHIDAFIDWRRELGNSPGTVNKYTSLLRVINELALRRTPPLCKTSLQMDRQKTQRIEKWWLRPEQLEDLTSWLLANGEPLFADYITILCYQGFRPTEALRLEPRHFMDLEGDKPMVQVPGTKTIKSGNAIPVFDMSVPIVKRCIERSRSQAWRMIFEPLSPRKSQEMWKDCREYLGVSDLKTATLRALRRTFGAYATKRGMPTKTLQEIYRHETITTTEGYLDLIGHTRVEDARSFFRADRHQVTRVEAPAAPSSLAAAIAAYAATGASPEQVASFVKEMMK